MIRRDFEEHSIKVFLHLLAFLRGIRFLVSDDMAFGLAGFRHSTAVSGPFGSI